MAEKADKNEPVHADDPRLDNREGDAKPEHEDKPQHIDGGELNPDANEPVEQHKPVWKGKRLGDPEAKKPQQVDGGELVDPEVLDTKKDPEHYDPHAYDKKPQHVDGGELDDKGVKPRG